MKPASGVARGGKGSAVRDESGLTIIEMMVALLVIGVVLAAMASVSITSMISMQRSERVVHSTQLGNEIIEGYLAVPYDDLGHDTDDATAHFGSAEFEGEDLVLLGDDPDAVPSRTTEIRSGVTYEIESAVTWVDVPGTDAAQDYKRITVMLTWEHRGTQRTARTEATRSPAPDEQLLSVTIEPDVARLRHSPEGAVAGSFVVTVVAKEPQSSVTVQWKKRDGSWLIPARDLGTSDPHRLVWTTTVNESNENARFPNGGNLFVIEGVSQGNEREETTIGRALFLHDLAIPNDRVDVTPSRIDIHPVTGACDDLYVVAEVVGALKSDPFSLTFDGQEAEDAFPFGADTDLTDGTRFDLLIEAADLPVEHGSGAETLTFHLDIWRGTDPVEPEGVHRQKTVVMDVVELEEGASCPE
jgi:prepilin-type N-terminal cleavage/methylation domain-containing protein